MGEKNKQNTSEAKIEELDNEIAAHEHTIRELDKQRLDREKQRNKLLDDRCDFHSRIIFADLEKLIINYLRVQNQYKILRVKVAQLADREPNWYRRAEQQKKHPIFTTIADSFLKVERLKGTSLGSFMNEISSINEPYGDKSPYPDLRRDI